eukprot:TRINITY_DN11471_c0_g1_i10.p2 TRINITY_DN11471_c0_g1~~TRINITY_DN11471_c0_g1_i10.p2  ORF type:complete len:286 (+),score=52.12 TRINITY_DN11471_c0_g1_i10:46-858(+)
MLQAVSRTVGRNKQLAINLRYLNFLFNQCQQFESQDTLKQYGGSNYNVIPYPVGMDDQRRFVLYRKRDIKRRISKRFENDDEFEEEEEEEDAEMEEMMGEPVEEEDLEGVEEEGGEEVTISDPQHPKDYSHIPIKGQPFKYTNRIIQNTMPVHDSMESVYAELDSHRLHTKFVLYKLDKTIEAVQHEVPNFLQLDLEEVIAPRIFLIESIGIRVKSLRRLLWYSDEEFAWKKASWTLEEYHNFLRWWKVEHWPQLKSKIERVVYDDFIMG